MYLFDERLIRDLNHPYRRGVLIRALRIKTDEQQRWEAGVKIANRFLEAIRNWLDIGFMSVIKAIPVFNREAAQSKRKITSLYGTDWKQYQPKKDNTMVIGGVKVRIAGEVDDSNRLIAGNWKERYEP